MIMKSLYFLLVVAFSVQLSKQDTCHMRELDLCAATALISLQNNPIPQNEEEIDTECTYLKEAVGCARNYTDKCLTPLYRQLLSLVTSASEENMNKFCTHGNEMRATLLKHSSCLAGVWDEQQSCTDDARAAIELITEVPAENRINLACCTYRRFMECIFGLIENKCGAEAKDFVVQFISFYVSNLPDVICNNFEPEDDTCKPLLPPLGTQPKGNNNSPLNQIINLFGRN